MTMNGVPLSLDLPRSSSESLAMHFLPPPVTCNPFTISAVTALHPTLPHPRPHPISITVVITVGQDNPTAGPCVDRGGERA